MALAVSTLMLTLLSHSTVQVPLCRPLSTRRGIWSSIQAAWKTSRVQTRIKRKKSSRNWVSKETLSCRHPRKTWRSRSREINTFSGKTCLRSLSKDWLLHRHHLRAHSRSLCPFQNSWLATLRKEKFGVMSLHSEERVIKLLSRCLKHLIMYRTQPLILGIRASAQLKFWNSSRGSKSRSIGTNEWKTWSKRLVAIDLRSV